MNNAETVKRTRQAVDAVLRRQGYVSAVDVLMEMGKLDKKDYEDWRFKRIPYLEKVIRANLKKISLILRTMRQTCEGSGLQPSQTAYMKWGKGKKRISLRFSKYGNPHVEQSYATHYMSKAVRSGDKNEDKTIAGKTSGQEALQGRRTG